MKTQSLKYNIYHNKKFEKNYIICISHSIKELFTSYFLFVMSFEIKIHAPIHERNSIVHNR